MVASTKGRQTTSTAFLRRRLTRIAPLYWLVTMAIFSALLVGLIPVGVASWEWSDIAASFLFLGMERSDGYPGPLLGVGWTLAYEAFFYAVFGVALFARKNAAALVVAVIMFCVLSGLIAKPTSFSAQFYTAPILLEFAFGMGLAHLTLKRAGGPLVAAGSIGLMVGAAILSAHIAQSHHTRWHWRNLEGDLFWSARHIDRCWGDFTGKFRGSLPKSVYPGPGGRQLCALPDTFAPDPSRGKGCRLRRRTIDSSATTSGDRRTLNTSLLGTSGPDHSQAKPL